MNFFELPPSKQWAALKYRGQAFAEAWIKPEDEHFALAFRIPYSSFQAHDISQLLTLANLIQAVGLAIDQLESWRFEDDSHSKIEGYHPELSQPLPPLPQNVAQLHIHVNLKRPVEAVANNESSDADNFLVKWQTLETRWNTILGMEVTIDTLRLRMEGLRAELESSSSKSLSTDEKLHAQNADVAQWTKAKSRARYALPKAKEFIHRATWAMGTPERKKLAELFKNQTQPELLFPQIDNLQGELENLLKDRQILSAQGVTVYQEGRSSCDDIQKALSTLQRNAAANAIKKRAATRKSF